MKPILEIQNLGKKYRIRHNESPYLSLRERLINIASFKQTELEDFWALSDISFEVQPGESIGIIGSNGAGKSTLLKILSRITPPSKGKVITRGRIASLLEVGTGFHPELTGRENIFFNGSLLGMKRSEIADKFDAIVDFSGVEKFLDTPLKHYSSGMQLRLAFAVAAFLEPEILIIDEVLAVGDAEFQKKCLGKMENVSKSGRTILFVSHNLSAVKMLCSKGLYISKGKGHALMNIDEAIALYSHSDFVQEELIFPIRKDKLILHNIKILQEEVFRSEFSGDTPIDLEIDFQLSEPVTAFRIGFYIKNRWGELMTRKFPSDWNKEYENLDKGRYVFKTSIPKWFLLEGSYTLELHASIFGIMDFGLESATQRKIFIKSPSLFNQGRPGEKTFSGYLLWNSEFTLNKDNQIH